MKQQLLPIRSLFCLLKSVRWAAVLFFTALLSFQSATAQQWQIIGNEGQISSAASFYTSIAVVNDVPYVAYVEGTSSGGIGKVKKRNLSSGAWEQVGANLSTANISYTRIYKDKSDKLYVTYVDVSSGKLAVLFYNTATQAWEPVMSGNPFVSGGSVTYTAGLSVTRCGLAFDDNNTPYIVFAERATTPGWPYVKRFTAGAWQTLGTGAISSDTAASVSIALDDNDIPFVVYIKQSTATASTGVIKTYRFDFDNNTWVDISPPAQITTGSASTGTTASRYTSITMDSTNNPVIAHFNTLNSNRSTIIRYNKTTAAWNYIAAVSTRDANNNNLVNDNGGNVYNSFTDNLISNGLSNMARVFKLQRGAAAFTELKNASFSRGIDSTGDNTTVARPVSLSQLTIAVGSDTSRPYITYVKTNSGGVITPVVQMFTLPVITSTISNLTSTTATTGGNVTYDGGQPITEKGVVYSTSLNPTTADTKMVNGSGGLGTFTSSITGLTPGTTYHVRAYAINTAGTTYGNDIAFFTPGPASNSVTIMDNGSTVVLDNGLVKATIDKSSARVTSLIYNGLEMMKGNNGTGNVYWSWNMNNTYQEPSGCTYTLKANPNTNNFSYAEIQLHMTYNSASTTASPMDVDIYYSLPKDASGLYAAASLTHPAAYPALSGGEWRMASSVNDRFNWLSVDSLRNRLMPAPADAANNVAVADAPPEVSRYTTGIYANQYECKYDYSGDFGDINVWGWSSTTDKVGIWVTAPSKEYYPGGPRKRELMSHGTNFMLNMIGGTHYGQGHETSVAAGEEWQKVYGPFLIYCNKVPAGTPNPNIALWNDAKAQALTEQAAWPYSWFTNTAYIKESGRGTVTGKLVVNDATTTGTPAANTWIGLGIPPAGSSSTTDFQDWSKNYQFWVKTDAAGNFTIPHVLPGTYTLFAFGPAAIGQLSLANYATVSAGNTTALGNVTWTPSRVAGTVWEIGTPDRNAMEYRHGNDWWTSNTYPDPRWGKFLNYPDEFPNDVNFTIGQSDIATDWNFVHYWNKNLRPSSPAWKVKFNLSATPTTSSTASVYVALAEINGAALILSVNGTNVTVPASGMTFSNSSNSMLRKGIHGAFNEVRFNFPASYLQAGANEIAFTLRVTGGGTLGDVMYDYIRLEADVPVILPMELSLLTGRKVNNTHLLSWSTRSEINTTKFQVLRGSTASPMEVIGSIKASGNSSVYIPYSFTDKTPLTGSNYYQLKMTDKDGKTAYSNIVLLKTIDNSGIVVYPNPVKNQLFIRSSTGNAIELVKLLDAKGNLLYSKGKTGTQAVVDVSAFPVGLYMVEVRSGGQVITEKINKQ